MTFRTLRQGSNGRAVTTLQNALNRQAGTDEHDCVGKPYPHGKVLEPDGDFGRITRQAVEAFQSVKKRQNPDFKKDGICGPETWGALGFTGGRSGSQQNRGAASPTPTQQRLHTTQGRHLGQQRATSSRPEQIQPPAGEEMPPWMAKAWGEYGKDIHESWGAAGNRRIIEYLGMGHVSRKTVGALADSGNKRAKEYLARAKKMDDRYEKNFKRVEERRKKLGKPPRQRRKASEVEKMRATKMYEMDEVPWCAAFVAWCLAAAGFKKREATHDWDGNFLGAKSWRPNDGTRGTPRYGAVCVKETDDGDFHVGFMIDHSAGRVRFLGGNQGDKDSRGRTRSGGAVTVAEYTQHTHYKTLTFLWPYDIWPDIDPPK